MERDRLTEPLELVRGRRSGRCSDPTVGYIEGWDLHLVGVCAQHAVTAPDHDYTVHRPEDVQSGEWDSAGRPMLKHRED